MSIASQFRTAPNLLTLLRLFLIPFLVIVIPDGHWRIAFALILLAGVSDSLDGLLARLLKQRTRLGQVLDPITDKLLLSTLFLVLTHVGAIPRYVTVLVFSRDLGIVVIAAVLYITNTLREFEPSLFGKLNTFVQIVAVLGIMADHVFTIPYLTAVDTSLLQVIAVLAPLSAAQYAWIVVRKVSLPEAPPDPKPN